MERRVVLTAIGADRPGLNREIAEAVRGAGGNWLQSHLSRMGGLYVGAVLVAIGEADQPRLEAAVRAIDASRLTVSVTPADPTAPPAGRALHLELVGQDRPGIVHEVSATLSALEVNILTLETTIEPTAHSGGALFRAVAELVAPLSLEPRRLAEALERISAEIMADIRLEAAPET